MLLLTSKTSAIVKHKPGSTPKSSDILKMFKDAFGFCPVAVFLKKDIEAADGQRELYITYQVQ